MGKERGSEEEVEEEEEEPRRVDQVAENETADIVTNNLSSMIKRVELYYYLLPVI